MDARRTGMTAIERAQARDRLPTSLLELKQVYLAEAAGDVGVLEDCLERSKADPAQWVEACRRMREVTHNIKGQGSSFGYPLMTQVGQSLSQLLKAIDDAGPETLKLVEAHVGVLRTVISMRIEGQGGESGARLINRLEDLVARMAG